ncbi:hypothetical protein TraAM80_05809 [Trypanosoma rangeli]|uniref:Uncharacterized protein n=1 Tax=Trypanosoma rangeli TaxID=5698 RepID=A0A3R7LU99_TRYRA|nr:uncharacterized protein TraAM80_05809 [Trypanosoma rangeli]RNF03460.1 hypothetical protein TraAM80_05809 [Trypanosoma rangeli]|eukprot:RNF03460.1 hypothetical protein TraAM80_05809 [Trypanosoma rangeli]
MHTAQSDRGNETPPPASFAITNLRTGEVLLELTSSPCALPAAPAAAVEAALDGRGFFSDAFAFLAAAQAKSYEFFGRNMAKDSKTRPAVTAAARGQKEQDVDPMNACDVPSSSCMDSAEWEGDDAGTNDDGHEDEDGDVGGDGPNSLEPPSKRRRG